MQRLRRKTLPIWPHAMASMGQRINTRTRKLGGSIAWFPCGPALNRYTDHIRPEIERILSHIELPEDERLVVKLYMIGRSEQKANPIIMICCPDKATCKEAEALIRESGLLDQEGNSGFGLGSTGLPLETSFLPRALGKVIYLDSDSSLKDALTIDVYGLTIPGIGRRLGFAASGSTGRVVQYATGGPIIRLGDCVFQLTVAHGVKHNPNTRSHHAQYWDTDECEFDGQPDEDEDDALILSRGSTSPEDFHRGSETDSDPQHSTCSETSSDIPDAQVLDREQVRATKSSPKPAETAQEQQDSEWDRSTLLHSFIDPHGYVRELDYLTIKLPEAPELGWEANQITVGEKSRPRKIQVGDIASIRADITQVFAVTSRGPVPGNLVSDSMLFKAGGSSSFHELLTVLLSEVLREGDSGSAIVDAQTGDFYGHVVLGVDGDSVAYVLPSPSIMAKITSQFGKLPSFYRPASRGYEGPKSASAAHFPRTENSLTGDTRPLSITSTGPFSRDQSLRFRQDSVPVDDVTPHQNDTVKARRTAEKIAVRSEVRSMGSAPKSATGFDSATPDSSPISDTQSSTLDQDFYDELGAMENWLRVLDARERSVALRILVENVKQAQIGEFDLPWTSIKTHLSPVWIDRVEIPPSGEELGS
jgi:hypothetical protein